MKKAKMVRRVKSGHYREYAKHKGAENELLACAWLLKKGYSVLRNVSPWGPVDLVAVEEATGKTILIDVKGHYGLQLTAHQKTIGVRQLVVHDGWVGWREDHPQLMLDTVLGRKPKKPHEKLMEFRDGKWRPKKTHPWRATAPKLSTLKPQIPETSVC